MTGTIFKNFENLVVDILNELGFEVQQGDTNNDLAIDLSVKSEDGNFLCDVKFFRSRNVSNATILASAHMMAFFLQQRKMNNGMLIVSSYVPKRLREEIFNTIGIITLDRSALYNIINNGRLDSNLLERFEQLLLSAKQGVDVDEVFKDVDIEPKPSLEFFKFLKEPTNKKSRIEKLEEKGKKLCLELNAINSGKQGWSNYEKKCIEILEYLFEEDLSLWSKQQRTDDELSRFDLICRITSNNDFWKTLIQSFQSRYILFEFKNYSNPITQTQIYSTERYLFTKALRSVCFMLTRNGANEQALTASKGALREHGKLILILDHKSICKMLELKDKNGLPTDYLSELLDEYLISLSR